MLNGKLELHGVKDVELVCQRVLSGWERRTRATLTPADREDALAFLASTAWEMAEKEFVPTMGVSFAAYCRCFLPLRLTDWLRQKEGRTVWKFASHEYTREKPVVLSLDGPAGIGGSDDGDVGRLGDRLPAVDVGAESGVHPDWGAALGRLLEFRGRERARLRALADTWLSGEVAA